MSEAERGVVLHARSLLSKWGFWDGDCPDEYLDWLAEQNPASSTELERQAIAMWRGMLRRLVRTWLLPLIQEDVVLYDIETSHNPIRAESVNGQPVDDYDLENGHMLADVSVTVPFAEVYEVQKAEEARPAAR